MNSEDFWVVEEVLAGTSRPGRHLGSTVAVPALEVCTWIEQARSAGVASIVCLLDDQHLPLYRDSVGDLIEVYRKAGFHVVHEPTEDHCEPPLAEDQLDRIWNAFEELPKPVLVHCSAGCNRTGMAVDYSKAQLGVK